MGNTSEASIASLLTQVDLHEALMAEVHIVQPIDLGIGPMGKRCSALDTRNLRPLKWMKPFQPTVSTQSVDGYSMGAGCSR